MKYLLLILLGVSFMAQSQVNYTVKVTKLKALADECDGEFVDPILGFTFCPLAPQDPVFQLWVKAEGNSNETFYCWAFDSDENQAYGVWNDIQDVEIATETNIVSDYLTFEASGFESDFILDGVSCSGGIPLVGDAFALINPDEAVLNRQIIYQIPFDNMQSGVPYVHTLSLGDVYFFEIEILFFNLAEVNEIKNNFSFTIAPNPSNGMFNIKLDKAIVKGFSAVVRDVMGRVIYAEETTSNKTQVDLSNQDAGVYFVSVGAKNTTSTQKVVLK
ncbi:MAG: T9SS type A sorting domain-containing protein [Crocinitomicaceae bacterium]